MSDLDANLENKLRKLENGATLESINIEFKGNSTELSGLVNLASTIRDLPHPGPNVERKQAARMKILAAARTQAPVSNSWIGGWLQNLQFNRVIIPALAGIFVILICMVVTVAGAGIWYFGPPGARAATLTDAVGKIEVATPDNGDGWKLISNGYRLGSGARIRSGDNSTAALEFFDGSRITLQPNSDLILTQVAGRWGDVLSVELEQNSGDTIHQVNPLRGASSSYVIITPGGSASVHGTSFEVLVEESGETLFKVDTGRVLVNSDGKAATLEPGQGLYAHPGGELSDPAYLFLLQGELTAQNGDTWSVEGITFSVTTDTLLMGDPVIGDLVLVEGRIAGEQWIADSVQPALTADQTGAFTGIVDSIGENQWTINGFILTINENSLIDEGIEPGTSVRVAFQILEDGSWLASRIDSLEPEAEEPSPTPPPDDTDGNPKFVFEPKTMNVQACAPGLEYTLMGSLMNDARRPEDIASDVLLGFEVTDGEGYFDLILLDPNGWGSIQPGEQVDFNVQITMSESWLSAPEDAKAAILVFVAQESGEPKPHRGGYTINLGRHCEEIPTETPSQTTTASPTGSETPTPTVTGTITITPTLTVTPIPSSTPIVDFCVGAVPHPKGMSLAQEYGVPYEEIMGWFCMHFGFGEIDLAYGLSLQYGVPVEEVFGLRQSGMGWGQIKKWYADQAAPPGPPSDDDGDKPGKGKDKDKPGGGPPPWAPANP